MVAVLVSNDGTEATFGVPAALERWDGSAWRAFRRTNMCLADWHCTARWYPPDAPEVQGAEDIGLGVAAGSPGPVERFTVDGLDPGWYRVVQEAYGGVVARGVFEVAADAPAATPLWPTDAPAVSVQPGLLATTGGAVTLVPLVAPVDGNLDAGMLEAAMTGLGPLALVQRWDGSGWTEAGDVETTAADEVSVPGELRATLPALEPGAYRVLLRGNGKELMGSFWVRGDAEDGDAAPPPEEPGPVSLWLSADRVPPGDTELVAILVSNDGTEATFGVYAELERWDGDSWVLERHSGLCLAEWHCTARMQPLADDLAIEDIGLWVDATTPGPVERFTVEGLDPGWYRLSTETNDGDVARGVFELADDAPEPAPLWPVDDVAVTVQPPLVQPYTADQEVAVSPLVPPVDGALDAGTIETAMAGLESVARLERWDGSGWVAADATPLTAPADASVPGETRATLPDLEPGAYRLVRPTEYGLRDDGAAYREVVGNLWVPGEAPARSPVVVADEHPRLPVQIGPEAPRRGPVIGSDGTVYVWTAGGSSCPGAPAQAVAVRDGVVVVYVWSADDGPIRPGEEPRDEDGWPAAGSCTADLTYTTSAIALPDGVPLDPPPVVEVRGRAGDLRQLGGGVVVGPPLVTGPGADPAGLVGMWWVAGADGEGTQTWLRLDPGGYQLWRECGSLDGGWEASPRLFAAAQPDRITLWCGDAPFVPWLTDARSYRPADGGWELLDALGHVTARLTLDGAPEPTAEPVAWLLADPPRVSEADREAFAEPAPLPDGLRPATTQDLIDFWVIPGVDGPFVLPYLDGSWEGSNGCSGMRGGWSVGEGGRLLATAGVVTAMHCNYPHAAFWFSDAERAGFDGDVLVLLDHDGAELGRLVRNE